MTREEAAEKIDWLYYEADYGNNLPDDMEIAVDMAIKALKQIKAIEGIIDVSNIAIQEDVIKYKMIVDIVKGG